MKSRSRVTVTWIFLLGTALAATTVAQTPPPAPVLLSPGNGAAVVQPVTVQWQAVVDPDGPIGSYSWQVSTSSTFGSVIASGFNNNDGDVPLPTQGKVSGLANGTYFWRVKAAQNVGGTIGFLDSPWSAPRSFTVTGLGPAPAGIPIITAPAFGAQFHPVEFFDITWTEVTGAQYYILEADEDAGFSHPINLGTTKEFGTKFNAGWGNEIPNVHYRVRAVSADNVWGRPSATLTVHITNTAPVPSPPTPLSPVGGATITLPFDFDWTDTANPQIVGYDIDIDDEPNFQGDVGVLMVTQISRSDYMVVPDPLVEGINRLPAGTYFWRVRAIHGNVAGPWSAGASFKIAPLPATPPGLDLFWILSDPGSVQGGNPTAARIALNMPAPAGGMLVHLASDFPGIEIPATVLIPPGSTDAVVSPVTTPPVSAAAVSTIRAALGLKWQQSSIGCVPILWNGALDAEKVVGGTTVSASVTLLGPAPPGGVEVSVVSGNTAVARPPDTVFVPEGATGATFDVATTAVTVPTRVVFDFGTAFENYRAPGTWLVVNPTGSPAPPPALSTVTLNPTSLVGGVSGTGTVTLTAPAPSSGLRVRLSGSMEGGVVVPAEVTVPAGLTRIDFPVTPPRVARPHWVIIQASEWPLGLLHAATLRVDPGGTGPNPLFAIDVRPNSAIGGTSLLGTVGLSVPAPAGGASVALVSSDPSVAQVPASVTVTAGNSTASFAVATSTVQTGASVSVTGTAGGASKTAFLNLGPDPNAPLALQSVTPSVGAVVGGNAINTTIFLNKAAPAGGAVVALSSSNTSAAQVPATVTVPAGLGFVTLNITTSPVTADTPVTITGTLGVSRTAAITVLAPPGALSSVAVSPTSVVGGSPATGTATLAAPAASGGRVVTLSSSNTGVATVPASVTVAAGATSATFPVATKAVGSTVTVTITGSAGGASRTATLAISPNLAGFRGPTANAADTGGDGNGFETGAANAHTDDAASAVDANSGTASSSSCTSTARDRHRFFNYGLGVAAGAGVLGVEVRLDARVDGTGGAPKMCVQLSWDGGLTWTTAKSTPTLTTTMASYILGGPADTWGRAWTSGQLSDASFRVRVVDVASSTARDFSLDWIAVRVTTGAAPSDTTLPTVSVTAPTAGATLSGTATISATASDNVGVTRVEFLLDGALTSTDTASPFAASWNTTTATNGAHSLAARAFDAAGNQGTSTAVGVTVNNAAPPTDATPPAVSVTAPAAGATVVGTATISATASDNVGVTRVEFLVDGSLLGTDTTSPYAASWNTTTATNGPHSIAARAFDAAGNQTTSAAVAATVNNSSAAILDLALSGVPSTIRRGQFFTATGAVANTGATAASGYTVLVTFSPTDSMRLESPQSATQPVATVGAGATQSVSWQMRADRAASATVTMTLRNSSGATVDTASRTLTITD